MQGDNQFFSVFGSGGSSSSGGISGSGTNNYVAKWTPDGTTLGNSLIRDNGTTIGINVSPISTAIVYIDNSTNAETLRVRNTRNDGYGINSQATGGGTNIYGGAFNATSSTSTNNIGIRASTQGTITGSNVGGSFATANTPYTTTYLGLEYVGIHSQVATNGAKNVAGLFISNSSNSTDNTGVYIKVSNAGSGNAYGIYEPDGAFNYFEGNVGIGVTPSNSVKAYIVGQANTTQTTLMWLTEATTNTESSRGVYIQMHETTDRALREGYKITMRNTTGQNYAFVSDIVLASTEAIYGVNNSVETTSSGVASGVYNVVKSSLGNAYGVYNQFTNPSTTNAYGTRTDITYNNGVSVTNIYGSNVDVTMVGVATATNVYMHQSIFSESTNGTATNVYGFRGIINADNSTNLYGLSINLSGASTNAWGLEIDVSSATGTTIYGIKQIGSSALNELQGNLTSEGQIWSQQPASAMPITTNNATFDCDNGNGQVLNLNSATGNVTLTFTNMKAGGTYFLKVIQNAITPYDIGTYSVSGGNVLFPSGTAPTISTGASAIDTIVFYYDGTNLLANFSQDYQ